VRDKVFRYIRDLELMRAGDRVAVAVSGGADSVALLRVLLELRTELGIVLAVAHFNHGLRGEQSNADQAFVAELARNTRWNFLSDTAMCATTLSPTSSASRRRDVNFVTNGWRNWPPSGDSMPSPPRTRSTIRPKQFC